VTRRPFLPIAGRVLSWDHICRHGSEMPRGYKCWQLLQPESDELADDRREWQETYPTGPEQYDRRDSSCIVLVDCTHCQQGLSDQTRRKDDVPSGGLMAIFAIASWSALFAVMVDLCVATMTVRAKASARHITQASTLQNFQANRTDLLSCLSGQNKSKKNPDPNIVAT
jgi:hypothetical protein